MKISDRTTNIIVQLAGLALLAIGLVSALIGPLETHVYRQFQEGGPFHYEGFGFGSLMFANITIQIAGYYVIAVLCLTLGYGHLKRRWWVRPAMTTLLIDWLIVGLPLSLLALMILLTSKRPDLASLPFIMLGFLLLYPALPITLLFFYRSHPVRREFEASGIPSNWLLDTPQSVRVAASLLVLLAIVLHFPLLLGGLFPLFGKMAAGLPGVLLIDVSIFATAVLAWGVSRRSRWAWWGAVLLLGLLTCSSAVTFLANTPHEIMSLMPLAPLEKEALSGIPVQGYHLALLTGMIPTAALIAVVLSRRGLIVQRSV